MTVDQYKGGNLEGVLCGKIAGYHRPIGSTDKQIGRSFLRATEQVSQVIGSVECRAGLTVCIAEAKACPIIDACSQAS